MAQNGILIDASYVIQSIVHNYTGTPPTGQTFVPCFPDLLVVGNHAPAWLLANDKLRAGIAITSVSLPAVNATYALDSTSQSQIFSLGSYARHFATFPSGSTQSYPDITGSVYYTFTVPVFVSFFQAVAELVSNIDTAAQTAAAGGSPSWPSQTIGIS